MGAWHTWSGGACPVHPDAVVRLQWRAGQESRFEYPAKNLVWRNRDQPFDIVGFKIISSPVEEETHSAWNVRAGGY